MNGVDIPTRQPGGSTDGGQTDLSRIRTVDGLDVKGKRVLLRVDFNVPMQDGTVTDATRITRVLPTIKQLLSGGAKVIVLTHLGRPKGRPSPDTSLEPVAAKLRELLGGVSVHFVKDCVGEEARRGVDALKPGEVAVLENLRYHAGEEKNDLAFAKRLAELGDIYVDDAFSSAHRAHASIEAITHILPSYAGLLMMAEIRALDRASEHPDRPVMAIMRRCQGFHQDPGVDKSDGQDGRARSWRRYGQHLPLRARRRDRKVALPTRSGAHCQGDHGARRGA